MNKRGIALLVISIIAGMLLGSLLGELIAFMCPAGVVKDFFLKSIAPGCGPFTVNLLVVSFTIGLVFKLNIAAVLGVFITVYYLRWYT